MYNLLRFLIRYYLFLLFVSLEVFCFLLIYRNSKFHHALYINVANNLSGKVYKTYRNSVDYLSLKTYNDSLVAENARLRGMLPNAKYDNKIDSGTITESSKRFSQVYSYIAARVTMNTVNRPSNIIYLDRGKLQGIDKQMGVISSRGIVGQVINVTDNYAAVMSVLSKDFKVSASFKKNNSFGTLYWNGGNSTTATLEGIPKYVSAKLGDTIVTSGVSLLFPQNVVIGTVKKINAPADKDLLEITVTLSTDFTNLNYVYVVSNLRKRELLTLDTLSGTVEK